MEEERRTAAETFLREKNKESKGIYGSGSGQSGRVQNRKSQGRR